MFRIKTINFQKPLLIFCFLSGFAALIYEIVWIRVISLIVGTTIFAVAIVVSVFMAGLGIGSIYFGRKADRTTNHLRLFSSLEFGIGIASLIILLVHHYLPALYRYINLTENISMPLIIVISTVIMFIPTFLMGGTLPILSKVFIKHREEIGKGIGLLYAFNTLGSIIGALLTGFFFIAYFGQNITQILAIVISLIVGFASFVLSTHKDFPDKKKKSAVTDMYPRHLLKISLLVAGFTGFCGLSYEILWVRSLHIFLANSTYSFTSVLIIFLSGISLGSFVFTKYLNRKNRLLLLLSICQTAIGVYVIITVLFLNELPSLLFAIRNILEIPALRITIPGLFLSFVIMFLPTFFMGVSFPLVCKIYTRSVQKLGQSIGTVYFLNTAGSILGSLVAGFILIPLLGIVKGIIFIAFINLFLGILLAVKEPHLKTKARFLVANCCIVIIIIFVTQLGLKNQMILPPSIYRTPTRSDKVLYYKETSAGTVIVTEDRFTGIRACYINNSAVCGTTYDALKVVKMLGHLPLLINPNAQNALIVGFGIGITASAVAEHNVKNIDCIEICPGVKEAAKFFDKFNKNIIHNPKTNFIGGDGRTFILLTEKKYDVISCDPTHPTLGCNNLYTKEYFQLCKKILNKNGVICQYLPLHKLSPREFKILIKTFYSVFPHTTVWLAHSHGILLASDKKIHIDFRSFSNRLQSIQDDILDDHYLLATSLFLDEEAVKMLTAEVTINTDDHPYLEFFTSSSLRRDNWDSNLMELIKHRINLQKLITDIDDMEKMERYLTAQKYFLSGLIYKNRGDIKNVIRSFRLASEINPENTEITTFLENELRQLRARHLFY